MLLSPIRSAPGLGHTAAIRAGVATTRTSVTSIEPVTGHETSPLQPLPVGPSAGVERTSDNTNRKLPSRNESTGGAVPRVSAIGALRICAGVPV
jgi:hypothetical protein